MPQGIRVMLGKVFVCKCHVGKLEFGLTDGKQRKQTQFVSGISGTAN